MFEYAKYMFDYTKYMFDYAKDMFWFCTRDGLAPLLALGIAHKALGALVAVLARVIRRTLARRVFVKGAQTLANGQTNVGAGRGQVFGQAARRQPRLDHVGVVTPTHELVAPLVVVVFLHGAHRVAVWPVLVPRRAFLTPHAAEIGGAHARVARVERRRTRANGRAHVALGRQRIVLAPAREFVARLHGVRRPGSGYQPVQVGSTVALGEINIPRRASLAVLAREIVGALARRGDFQRARANGHANVFLDLLVLLGRAAMQRAGVQVYVRQVFVRVVATAHERVAPFHVGRGRQGNGPNRRARRVIFVAVGALVAPGT
jgi:hypothetical protein